MVKLMTYVSVPLRFRSRP